jgi:hypothetical protein
VLGLRPHRHLLPQTGGRIREISTGQAVYGIADEVPTAGPSLAGRLALLEEDTLIAMRPLVDEAISDVD